MKTMIYLDEDEREMAELIRRALDEYLRKYTKKGGDNK
jgi:hypothetical protein